MDKRTHRLLTTLTLSLSGVTGLLAATDPTALGVPAHTWGFVCLGTAIAGVVATAARTAWEKPDAPQAPPAEPPA